MAREAVQWAQRTEIPILRADAWRELATVLRLAAREGEATTAMNEALVLYAGKGDVVSAARARAWLAAPAFP